MRPGGLDLTIQALEFIALQQNASVIDVGCGIGTTLRYMERYRHSVFGLDISLTSLLECGKESKKVIMASGDFLPYKESSFDALFCECSLSLMGLRKQVLSGFYSVLRPGGWLVLSDLYWKEESCGLDIEGGHGITTRECLLSELNTAGFETKLWQDHTHAIKELAASWLLRFGTLDGLYRCLPGSVRNQTDVYSKRIAANKPGYFLAIASHSGSVERLNTWKIKRG
jgi:SAM-dependent methyltransferase